MKSLLLLPLVLFTLVSPACAQWDFIRGDCNDDGAFNIADPVQLVAYLFLGEPSNCRAAMDGDDNDVIDLADAVIFLNMLFNGTAPPSPPFPSCGPDPTPGILCTGPLNACGPTGQLCTDNSDCPPGEYCQKPAGHCDGDGGCTLIGTVCPAVIDPVCGCDGNTYGNACNAATAGVNVVAAGNCP